MATAIGYIDEACAKDIKGLWQDGAIFRVLQVGEFKLGDSWNTRPKQLDRISDEEIEQVATDECQGDWNDLKYEKIAKEYFIKGAEWHRNRPAQYSTPKQNNCNTCVHICNAFNESSSCYTCLDFSNWTKM